MLRSVVRFHLAPLEEFRSEGLYRVRLAGAGGYIEHLSNIRSQEGVAFSLCPSTFGPQ